MTRLARFRSGAQVLDGSWNGPRKRVERRLENLTGARKFRFDVPGGAGPDVAIDAGHTRMGRLLVGDELGIHDRVAKLSAKTNRVGEVVGLVTANDAHADEYDHEGEKESNCPTLRRIGKIETHVGSNADRLQALAAIVESAKDGERQPEYQEAGGNHVGENAHIRAGVGRGDVDEKQEQYVAEGDDGESESHDGDGITDEIGDAGQAGDGQRSARTIFGHGRTQPPDQFMRN